MMYTQQNTHPDLKYIETKGVTVWFQCQKCKTYQHSLQHFGWRCSTCQYLKKDRKEGISIKNVLQ